MYFWSCWVFVAGRAFSLVAASWGYSLDVVCRLLIAGVSLVAERGVQGTWASVIAATRLGSCGSQVPEHRLKSCAAWA